VEGRAFGAPAVVITTGTFLRGRIHIGTTSSFSGGRAGEKATVDLAEQLEGFGLTVERFKTGTPPRVDGRSVAFDRTEAQPSEIEQFDYSWSHFWPEPRRQDGTTRHPAQMPCWITHLEGEGKAIITENIARSAMYGGAIASRGPRYCPSVEDKIVKFPAAERHQLFLEPEGHDTAELYVNGMSTSLPAAVQLDVLRTVRGLEDVRMTRAGYAIEYDYYPPTQLDPSLQVKAVPGLFFAGQINGTTGYEEAAGQGALAGMNAGLRVLRREPVILGRETSYIGVLIDDLVTRGVDEPYRLFTSRSEFRLTVRQDNALRRLGPIAARIGLFDDRELAMLDRRLAGEDASLRAAADTSITPEQAAPILATAGTNALPHPVKVEEVARRHGVALAELFEAVGLSGRFDRDAVQTAELEIKYAGYFEREREQADRLRKLGDLRLGPSIPYLEFQSLSVEARQKLAAIEPATMAQAAGIPGVNPVDLQNLIIELEKRRRAPADAR
jgi:tRNA uridine 5-carboxymethylaminomethyl modification enzyme